MLPRSKTACTESPGCAPVLEQGVGRHPQSFREGLKCTACELRAERLSSRLGSWDSGSGLSTKMNLRKSDCSSLGAFGSCPSLGPARIVPNDGVDVLEAPVNLHLPLDPLILPRMRGFPGPTLGGWGDLPAARIEGGQRSSYPPSRPPVREVSLSLSCYPLVSRSQAYCNKTFGSCRRHPGIRGLKGIAAAVPKAECNCRALWHLFLPQDCTWHASCQESLRIEAFRLKPAM